MEIIEVEDSQEFIFNSFDDKPAVIIRGGDKYWYRNDQIYRDNDKPAVIGFNGDQAWYQHGEWKQCK